MGALGGAMGRRRAALLLIDWQRSFIDGPWAQHFGRHQVGPIAEAVTRTAALFQDRDTLQGVSLLCSRCYLNTGSEPPPELHKHLNELAWVHKPTTNIMLAAGFSEWIEAEMLGGVQTLVIGGCTTTSCVRVSSQAVKAAYGPRLSVVVDLSLCGAREDNYSAEHATKDPELRRIYGTQLDGRSAVDLAILQMEEAGVLVIPSYFQSNYVENPPG